MNWKTALAFYAVYFFVLFGLARSASADEDSLSILFGGDTSFGENYQERVAYKGGENMLVTHGYGRRQDGVVPFPLDQHPRPGRPLEHNLHRHHHRIIMGSCPHGVGVRE